MARSTQGSSPVRDARQSAQVRKQLTAKTSREIQDGPSTYRVPIAGPSGTSPPKKRPQGAVGVAAARPRLSVTSTVASPGQSRCPTMMLPPCRIELSDLVLVTRCNYCPPHFAISVARKTTGPGPNRPRTNRREYTILPYFYGRK